MSAGRWLVLTAATIVVLIAVSVERTVVEPPFGVGGWTATHVFVVAREADAWRIVSFDGTSPCF